VFLADSLRLVARGLPMAHPLMSSMALKHNRDRAARVDTGYEKIGFSRSAMAVAADLRMDNPERMENVARAVLDKPRRIFVEAEYAARVDCFSRMRGFPRVELPEGRYLPARVGLEIDVHGNGRATIGSIWNFPRRLARMEHDAVLQMSRAATRLEREALAELSRMGAGLCVIEVDVTAAAGGLTQQEFVELFEAEDPAVARERRAAARLATVAGRDLTPRGRALEGWRLYRLNRMCRARAAADSEPAMRELADIFPGGMDQVWRNAERDLDGEIIHALAFLAALEAGPAALQVETRELRAPRRNRRPVAPGDLGVDRLSVMSMRISDVAIARYFSRPAPAEGEAAGRPRVRHPVQGHLFRARNGLMVYRRPHWRGGVTPDAKNRILRVF